MFIDWASHLHLLEHDAQAHILKDFALNVKKILVSQVATFLQEPKIATLVLSSPSHVTWAMETVGEGFNLPIEEEDSIAKAITLYKTWALEPTKRPNAINDNPQFFMQRILGHLSLMFQPRTNTKEGVDKHAAFCSTVLDIYVEIGRTVGSKLSVETWELFLKLLISLTDLLLREDLPGTQELQRKLCSQLLRVLFELWLLSRTRNPTLWAALKERVRGWTHHTALITTWKSICIALTKRSTSILYGKSEGTDCVIISTDHDSIQKINLEDEYVFYSWHRMLNLIGNPNESISLPYNFFDFLSGVEILVNQYLKIGMSSSQENSRYLPPSGNTILHIFGTWLFDAIHLNRKGFEEGTALATKILVTTVSQKQSTPFLPVYSSSFFSSLRHALTQEERVLITAISSSTALFTLEVSGIRCLIPSFVEAIQRICEGRAKLGNNVLPEEQVRRSCYEILSSLICLPNHFSTTKFFVQGESQSATTLETYESLREPFSSILLTALDRETLPANIESLLSLIFTWQFETISCGRTDFIKKSLKAILQKVKSKAWIPTVTLRALRSLGEMAVHYENMGSKRAIQATSLVDTLCRIITQIGNPAVAPHDEISAACYYTITKWIIAKDQWLLDIHETRQTLLSVIVNSLCCKQEPTSEAEKEQASKGTKRGKDKKKDEKLLDKPIAETSEVIKKAARYTLQVLVNVLGNFPSASGPASFSSLATEEDVLRQMISQPNSEVTIENSIQYVRYFMTEDNVIICVIDRRDFDPDGKPCVCVILRDPFGRYTWDTKLSFLPLNPPEPTAESGEETPPSSAPTTPLCDSNGEEIVVSTPFERSSKDFNPETDLSNVMDFLTKKTSPPADAIQSITQQVQKETKILQSKKYHLDVNIRIHAPVVQRMEDECRVKESRMFLSQIGLLSLENRDKLYPLAMNSTLFSLLHQLDQQAERTCIRVGVLYIRKGQSESEWFGNEHGDMDYQQFVATLGWGIEITRHNGFTGTLDLTGNTSGSLAPYYSDFDTEIIFQTCTLMPNSSTYPDHGHKRKQATNGSCLVAWVEDLTGFQPSLIWKKLRHSALIVTITPNENGLYLIRLFSKTPEHSFGPLIDGMVLRKEVIAPLVRATAVNAWQIYENSNNIIPAQPRSDTIQKIFNSCKLVDNLEEFYVPLFTDIVVQESSAFTSSLKKSLRSPRHRKPTKARASANRPASHIEEVSESEGDESKRERSRRKKKRPKTTI